MTLTYASACSGIGAPEVAWSRLGWRSLFCAEIGKFPSAVLAAHHPATPNLGDIERIKRATLKRAGAVDVFVAGTPCQSFSVAGLRKGMDDPRGNLALVFLRLVAWSRPRWVVWENVDGVRSSGRGRDFGSFLGALGQLGYGWAYRVLDAQYGGVPQRRRRVFVVGRLGDWRRAAAALFERQSLSGNPPPRRTPGARTAATLTASLGRRCGQPGGTGDVARGLAISAFGGGNTAGQIEVGTCLTHHGRQQDFDSETLIAHTLRAEGHDASEDGIGRGVPLVCGTLTGNGDAHSGFKDERGFVATAYTVHGEHSTAMTGGGGADVAFAAERVRSLDTTGGYATNQGGTVVLMENGSDVQVGGTPHLRDGHTSGVPRIFKRENGVRRLMPVECERLMGFPDGYTAIEFNGKPAADGLRYQALGNSMVVNEMDWIGRRIDAVEGVAA